MLFVNKSTSVLNLPIFQSNVPISNSPEGLQLNSWKCNLPVFLSLENSVIPPLKYSMEKRKFIRKNKYNKNQLKNKKVLEIREIATLLNINLLNNNKKKTKSILIDDILSSY